MYLKKSKYFHKRIGLYEPSTGKTQTDTEMCWCHADIDELRS